MRSHGHPYDPGVFLRLLPLLFVLLPAVASAQASDHDAVRREVQAGRLQPLSEILRGVQQRHGGRVIDVELERGTDGKRWYEIKLVDARQQRREIHVDAVTGREITKPGAITTQVLPPEPPKPAAAKPEPAKPVATTAPKPAETKPVAPPADAADGARQSAPAAGKQ